MILVVVGYTDLFFKISISLFFGEFWCKYGEYKIFLENSNFWRCSALFCLDFGSFLSKYSYFWPILFPILVAEHVYEPYYMVYVMGIVASCTLEEF